MTRAVGYIRVSTEKQKQEGFSLEAQEKKIRAMAEIKGVYLERIISDEVSGKSLDRPGATQLLGMVQAKTIDMVIVAKLDRLTRSIKDIQYILELFDKTDVALVSADGDLDTKSASGRMIINMRSVISQWEREIIGERTREALAVKKANGERVGTVPYGMKEVSGKLIANDMEVHTIKVMQYYEREGLSLRKIAAKLNAAQHPTRSGSPWTREGVFRILKNAKNQ